ncbi:hypothetical protein C2S51_032967 [Perilla frutescens var. frutescens]|nr:hypothetical protein C2S51_032967 [Perilla frutescens var. frutescens]
MEEMSGDVVGNHETYFPKMCNGYETTPFTDLPQPSEFGNPIRIPAWPVPPSPHSCSCCQTLREFFHVNGGRVMKLVIHGRLGLINHAVMERYDSKLSSENHEYYMFDFCKESISNVKQFLVQYCNDRKSEGYIMLQDPLSNFYNALCTGLEPGFSPHQTSGGDGQTSQEGGLNQPEEEGNGVRLTKSYIASQRERAGNMTLKDLEKYFHLPMSVASKEMKLCPSAIKSICRKGGLKRWPHRKIKSITSEISKKQCGLNSADDSEQARILAEIQQLQRKLSNRKSMAPSQKLVCIKNVKQESAEEWDETMPLPGDIIEGIAADSADESFVSAKARAELNSQLGRIHRVAEHVWLKVRRGEGTLKLRVCVIPDANVKVQKFFTVRAATDERHVAVLAELTFQECFELQEMSRRVVNLDFKGFHRKGIKYDWKNKVGSYLPDRRSTVVSSILFMPLSRERGAEAPTVRAMAWFSAAISSGIPLVFTNIQTEQIITSATGKELAIISRLQNTNTTIVNVVQGIRLWFLPGLAEVPMELFPQPGEVRFGMDIKRTEEGFICVYSVSRGTAAERAGLGQLFEQANKTRHLLVISRLQGKSLMPSTVDSDGLIHCCDNADIRHELFLAMEKADSVQLHLMSWPNETVATSPVAGAAALRPPESY